MGRHEPTRYPGAMQGMIEAVMAPFFERGENAHWHAHPGTRILTFAPWHSLPRRQNPSTHLGTGVRTSEPEYAPRNRSTHLGPGVRKWEHAPRNLGEPVGLS
jgi:hypothetical protein